MIKDIANNIEVIETSIAWADKYGKDAFPREIMKEHRRKLKKIDNALSENCSAAAYGESQVGKSYLMSSLLSTPDKPFVINNDGKAYSFIDEINPSGGANTKEESTGVITRFTIRQDNVKMANYVKIETLSIVDIILLLVDSYYNDVKINSDSVLMHDKIDAELESMSDIWSLHTTSQNYITEDDIRDICDYIKDIIGSNAVNVSQSKFRKIVAPAIQYISHEHWVKVFGLLWNNNPDLNNLFNALINEYKKLNFQTDLYVPFAAVLRNNGTILKIDWLDSVCGIYKDTEKKDVLYTDVYDKNGDIVAHDFSKAYLSALIGELTFVLPKDIANDRNFLTKIDLLDFPGARSREKIKEQEIGNVLPTILRRGKVAYLFNKYSRSLKISAVLFCHHNDQKTEPSIGSTINCWIEDNIGETPDIRASYLQKTKGIAPLFMICTKFNIDLAITKTDAKGALTDHWGRFSKTIPEIIQPETWMENWVVQGGIFNTSSFQNVYLLRDFYWSAKNQVFDGYNEKTRSVETGVHIDSGYPEYFNELQVSFLENRFVKKHFKNPKQAWEDVATINNDGSKAIIRNLDAIADVLDDARRQRYMMQLIEIKDDILNRLKVYYESDDNAENNAKIRRITGDIKLRTEFAFGEKPELFGQIIDNLMVPSSELRDIAYDIIVRHTDEPKSVSSIKMIRALCEVNTQDERSTNIQKLCRRYNKEEYELKAFFTEMGITLEDILSDNSELLATVPDVIAKHIVDFWNNHINQQVKRMSDIIPHADEIAFMIMTLLEKAGVKKELSDKINKYYLLFEPEGLPNAIADYASLALNNFVSTVGRGYLSESDMENIAEKAKACDLEIDLSPAASSHNIERQPLLEVLSALDQSHEAMNNDRIDLSTLKKLPFWDNYQRWENFITIGLLYTSDISRVDPIANDAIKSIIDSCDYLYNEA